MNRILFLLLFLMPLYSYAQQSAEKVTFITKDSLNDHTNLSIRLSENWRFHKGDASIFADTAYNDNNWQIIQAKIRPDSELAHKNGYYSRIDWYRLHIWLDSEVTNLPLSMKISGYGAFEIYLDGKKIKTLGKISTKGQSEFIAPRNDPFMINIKSPGRHVIAVRFANYSVNSIFKDGDLSLTGFSLLIGEANNMVLNSYVNVVSNVTLLIFLASLFFVLSVIHFLLFLFSSSVKSNLYFSIFSLSLSSIIFQLYLWNYSDDPYTLLLSPDWAMTLSVAVFYLSFSGTNNELFSAKRTRFRVIALLSVLCCLISFYNLDAGGYALMAVGIIVLAEALILPVAGIYKKIKGAKIVGSGVLFFAAFILFAVIYIAFLHELSFSSQSITGRIVLFLAACAILSIPFSMSVYLAWQFAAINKDIKKQLQQVKLLSEQTLEQEQEKKRIIEGQKEHLEQQIVIRTAEVTSQKEKIEKQHEELKVEKKKSDDLLLNILPEEVAEELKQKGHSDAKYFDDVTVLFTDFVDFTSASEAMSPVELINELNTCFIAFDEIISKNNIEKIKTIGDAYLAVCGLPLPVADHAVKAVSAAMEIMQFMTERKKLVPNKTFEVRIGIHSGSVVAGIIGVKKFAYDIWGDTVNTAARIEQNSEAGKVNISNTVYNLVKDKFVCTYRGEIKAKNKGELSMYFVEGTKAYVESEC